MTTRISSFPDSTDPSEGVLATALTYLRQVNCGPHAPLAALENARREASHPRRAARYGWRQLVHAY